MNQLIISTRDTTRSYIMAGLCLFALDAVLLLCIVWPAARDISCYSENLQDSIPGELKSALVFGILGCIYTAAIGAVSILGSRTYVEVFEDHIEGVGFREGIRLMDFNLSIERITNVTYKGSDLYFHSSGEKYRVRTNARTAKEIFAHFNK